MHCRPERTHCHPERTHCHPERSEGSRDIGDGLRPEPLNHPGPSILHSSERHLTGGRWSFWGSSLDVTGGLETDAAIESPSAPHKERRDSQQRKNNDGRGADSLDLAAQVRVSESRRVPGPPPLPPCRSGRGRRCPCRRLRFFRLGYSGRRSRRLARACIERLGSTAATAFLLS